MTITGAPDITSSLDGSDFDEDPVVTVSGTGLHTVEYQGSNGAHGITIVPIDVTAPTVAIAALPVSSRSVRPRTSGSSRVPTPARASLRAHDRINTSTPTLTGKTRKSRSRRPTGSATTSASAEYRVVYAFRGFFQPVDNLPVLNSVNAGSGCR